MYVFDAERGLVKNIGRNGSYLHCVAVDGDTLAWGGEDGDVCLCDVRERVRGSTRVGGEDSTAWARPYFFTNRIVPALILP